MRAYRLAIYHKTRIHRKSIEKNTKFVSIIPYMHDKYEAQSRAHAWIIYEYIYLEVKMIHDTGNISRYK